MQFTKDQSILPNRLVPKKRYFQDLWNDKEPISSQNAISVPKRSSKRQKVSEVEVVKTEMRISSSNPVREVKQRAFVPIIVPTLKKIKKKTKSEKKYTELQNLLEKSDKFYKEVKTPAHQDEHTLNAILVYMEDEGICSVATSKQFSSWPEYCRQNRFISKLNGQIPDMIVPENFSGLSLVTDQYTNKRKPKSYLEKGGLVRMNQKKNVFFDRLKDQKNMDQNIESDMENILKGGKHKGQSDNELSDSMDEDDEPQFYDSLFDSTGNQKDFISPVIFDANKKKDKTLKCRKCFKGGHLDVHCPIQIENKWSCHVCESDDLDHDSFTCPWLNERCRNCHQTGHIESHCRLGSIHIDILKMKQWSAFNQLPQLHQNRVIHPDQILEFNYDKVINTDLRKLLNYGQEQEWLQVKKDDMEKQCLFFHKINDMIEENYFQRQQKKNQKRFKPSQDDVDMENPPIPDYHKFSKVYCPECTKPHLISDCDKNFKGRRPPKETDWEAEQNPAFLKGKAKRMAKFKFVDRNMTKLQGSYSKSKTKLLAKRNESKTRRLEKQQELEMKFIENQKVIEMQNSLRQLQKFQAPSQVQPQDCFDPWGQPKLPEDTEEWPTERNNLIYDTKDKRKTNSGEWFKELKQNKTQKPFEQKDNQTNINELSFLLRSYDEDNQNETTRSLSHK